MAGDEGKPAGAGWGNYEGEGKLDEGPDILEDVSEDRGEGWG